MLHEVVRSSRAPGVSETKMCSFIRTKALVNKFIQSVLSSLGLFVPIAEHVEKMLERDFNEFRLRHMEEASTTFPQDKSRISSSPLCVAGHQKYIPTL